MSHSQNAKNGDNGCVNVTYEARAQPIDNKKQPKSQAIFNINSLFFAFCGPSKYRASQKGMYVFKFGDKVRQVAPTSHSRKIQGQFSQPRTSHLVKLWKSEVHHQRERSREKTDRTDSGRSAGMKLTANCARDTKWRKFSLTVGTAAVRRSERDLLNSRHSSHQNFINIPRNFARRECVHLHMHLDTRFFLTPDIVALGHFSRIFGHCNNPALPFRLVCGRGISCCSVLKYWLGNEKQEVLGCCNVRESYWRAFEQVYL